MDQFNCGDCNHVFDGDDLNYHCPNCQSENTETVRKKGNIIDRIIGRLKGKNKFIYLSILLAIIFVLFNIVKYPVPPSNQEFSYEILIDSIENEYFIKVMAHAKGSLKPDNKSISKPLITSIKNAENLNHTIKFDKKTGKLLLCPSDTVDIIAVKFTHNQTMYDLKERVRLNLNKNYIINNKDCPVIVDSKDFDIGKPNNKNCITKISISIRGKTKGLIENNFRVSVDGKNGVYYELNKNYEYNEMPKILNVFFLNIETSDTIEYMYNGDPFPLCTPKNWSQVKSEVQKVVLDFLINPIKRENTYKLREINNAQSLEIIVENVKISFNQFENQIPVDFENSNQIKYKLKTIEIRDPKIIIYIEKL